MSWLRYQGSDGTPVWSPCRMYGYGLGVSVMVAVFDTEFPGGAKLAVSVTGTGPVSPVNMLSSRKVIENGNVNRCGFAGSIGSSGITGPAKAIVICERNGVGTVGRYGGVMRFPALRFISAGV